MFQGKQNDLNSFSKIIKKLQMENVSIPELRLLKQQHSYLEKLKQQRQKIEELKMKYNESEEKNQSYASEVKFQQKLIEDQHRKISTLEDKLQEMFDKKSELEEVIAHEVSLQKEKNKQKIYDYACEIEALKKQIKSKNISIFNIENEYEEKFDKLRQDVQFERRKIHSQYEDKFKTLISESNKKEDESQQLKQLITRQHQALQLQNEQFESVSSKYDNLECQNQKIHETLASLIKQKQHMEQKWMEAQEINLKLGQELSLQKNNEYTKGHLEEIRKKMSEMTKGEIERIQFIVNQFE